MHGGGDMTAADLHKALCAGAAALALAVGPAFGAETTQPAARSPPAAPDDPAPTLWRNVRLGMTLAKVRMLVPQSHAPVEPDRLLIARARAALETAGSIQGKPSQVRFYFTDRDELLAVIETMKDRALSFDDVSKLVQEISARQSPARDCDLKRDTMLNGCIWMGKSLTITMISIVMPENLRGNANYSPGQITLNYISTAYYRSMHTGR